MKKRTYADKALGDTEWLLEWGYWRMDGMGVPRYVSPLQALICDNNASQGGIKEYSLTDDSALVIDGAVSRLTSRDQQLGDFIWWYYGAKWTADRIGRANGMSERKAREIIKMGVAWVDAVMEARREAA